MTTNAHGGTPLHFNGLDTETGWFVARPVAFGRNCKSKNRKQSFAQFYNNNKKKPLNNLPWPRRCDSAYTDFVAAFRSAAAVATAAIAAVPVCRSSC